VPRIETACAVVQDATDTTNRVNALLDSKITCSSFVENGMKDPTGKRADLSAYRTTENSRKNDGPSVEVANGK
jgi:hypothetical protein